MPKKYLYIILAVLAGIAVLALVLYQNFRPKTKIEVPEEKVKVPQTNPFEAAKTNPFKDIKTNPFE